MPRLAAAIASATLCTLWACAGDSGRPAAADLAIDPTGQLVVARVNGEPVLASCVKQQAHARGIGAREALDECVAFELLAQEARRRDLHRDARVHEVGKREAVRELIETQFAAGTATPKAVPNNLAEKVYNRQKSKWVHPEYRNVRFVRAPVPKNTPTGSPVERAAKRVVDEVYAALRDKRHLSDDEFVRIAVGVAGDRTLETHSDFNFPLRGRALPEFADAAFAIAEIGMVSRPVRVKKYGWDVILLKDIFPAENNSFSSVRDRIRQELHPVWRSGQFEKWSDSVQGRYDWSIDKDALAALKPPDAVESREKSTP